MSSCDRDVSPCRKTHTGVFGPLSAGLIACILTLSGCSLRGPDIAADTQSAPDISLTSTPEGSSAPQSAENPQSTLPSMPAAPTSFSPIIGPEAWTQDVHPLSFKSRALPTSLVFHNVRIGEHPDFYRVVIDFEEVPGTPLSGEVSGAAAKPWKVFAAWSVAPLEQGRGQVLDVAGNAFLDLNISRTSMPASDEVAALYYTGPNVLSHGPLQVRVDHTFEDNTHIVIGMDSRRDVQMGYLLDPTRLVVDVKK